MTAATIYEKDTIQNGNKQNGYAYLSKHFQKLLKKDLKSLNKLFSNGYKTILLLIEILFVLNTLALICMSFYETRNGFYSNTCFNNVNICLVNKYLNSTSSLLAVVSCMLIVINEFNSKKSGSRWIKINRFMSIVLYLLSALINISVCIARFYYSRNFSDYGFMGYCLLTGFQVISLCGYTIIYAKNKFGRLRKLSGNIIDSKLFKIVDRSNNEMLIFGHRYYDIASNVFVIHGYPFGKQKTLAKKQFFKKNGCKLCDQNSKKHVLLVINNNYKYNSLFQMSQTTNSIQFDYNTETNLEKII